MKRAARNDTVLSAALLARAAVLDGEVAAALARRQTVVAGGKIAEAMAVVNKVAVDYPRGRALEGGLRLRLAFLAMRRAELDALQEQVYSRLGSLGGARGLRLLKTEVPQDLYTRVMNDNPSRNVGRALPVDSVSWADTQEFCARLSWLLGTRVRLPTEAEFRVALISSDRGSAGTTASAWTADTSGGHSHETGQSVPGAAGIYDLTGNLAEWLQPAEVASETAPVAGGSYLDATDAVGRSPVTVVEKRERARHIGFRVVVELPAD
ncbi:MAG: hypothetical protein EXS32_11690 [Opitutus sp.]|nr:hypothetical protein [Opitutus sp.]